MRANKDWTSECSAILFAELAWNTREADACADAVEAGKYRHEARKVAEVLLALIRVQTMNRPATQAEQDALGMADYPAASITHRLLLQCQPPTQTPTA